MRKDEIADVIRDIQDTLWGLDLRGHRANTDVQYVLRILREDTEWALEQLGETTVGVA